MPYKDIKEYVRALERNGLLLRVKATVSPMLEITELADRFVKSDGPALLFESVEGSSMPVLINALAGIDRIHLALETESLDHVAKRLQDLLSIKPPETVMEKLRILPHLSHFSHMLPKTVSHGSCQDVVRESDASLFAMPVLQCWPDDGGRFITLPLVFTKDPNSGRRNCGMYRMQVYDRVTAGMHWQIHKHGAAHFRQMEASRAHRMDVAIAIGADPVTTMASVFPAPDGMDEMLLAGFLRGTAVEMVQCKTVDLQVPAHAEIILEGYVTPGETRLEGPFGDHTGFYSPAEPYPVFHLTALTHCKNPIYHTTIVGRPPMEDCWLGKAVERVFLPALQMQFPEIVDIHLPFEGVFHNLMLVSIKKAYPGHARKIMHGLWGLGQAMFTKCMIIVDHDVNVQDLSEMAWIALNHIDPQRDMEFSLGPLDSLDHAGRLPNFGSKVGIDATRKWTTEGFTRSWPEPIRMSRDIQDRVNARWTEYFPSGLGRIAPRVTQKSDP